MYKLKERAIEDTVIMIFGTDEGIYRVYVNNGKTEYGYETRNYDKAFAFYLNEIANAKQ